MGDSIQTLAIDPTPPNQAELDVIASIFKDPVKSQTLADSIKLPLFGALLLVVINMPPVDGLISRFGATGINALAVKFALVFFLLYIAQNRLS
jgi:hypothetical protein